MENRQDELESLNPEGEGEAQNSPEAGDLNSPEGDDLNSSGEETVSKAYAENQKIRAEKAEKELKALKKQLTEKETPKNEFSVKDYKALSEIHEDDIDEVIEYAKFKGISVAETVKSQIIQALLKEKEEKRKSAAAANTLPARRSSQTITEEALLEQVEGGFVPTKDEDIEKFVKAKLNRQIKKT